MASNGMNYAAIYKQSAPTAYRCVLQVLSYLR
jgi:hypothetical protein